MKPKILLIIAAVLLVVLVALCLVMHYNRGDFPKKPEVSGTATQTGSADQQPGSTGTDNQAQSSVVPTGNTPATAESTDPSQEQDPENPATERDETPLIPEGPQESSKPQESSQPQESSEPKATDTTEETDPSEETGGRSENQLPIIPA